MIKGNKKTVKKDLEMGRKWKNTKENARIYGYEKKGEKEKQRERDKRQKRITEKQGKKEKSQEHRLTGRRRLLIKKRLRRNIQV